MSLIGAYGGALPEALPLMAADLGVRLLYGLCGYALFRRMEVQARRRATFESV